MILTFKLSSSFHCSWIYEAKGYGHGYLSVYLPEEWLRIALPFFEGKDPNAPGE